ALVLSQNARACIFSKRRGYFDEMRKSINCDGGFSNVFLLSFYDKEHSFKKTEFNVISASCLHGDQAGFL
ncbi:hypothetical protein, partial [Acetobacter malorum]|uniref:hypothetical protein n=1 Tax=Acetobacter malorum TaxID=178901 RepID=UPI0039EC2343